MDLFLCTTGSSANGPAIEWCSDFGKKEEAALFDDLVISVFFFVLFFCATVSNAERKAMV